MNGKTGWLTKFRSRVKICSKQGDETKERFIERSDQNLK